MQEDVRYTAEEGDRVAVRRQNEVTGDWEIFRYLRRNERWKFHIYGATLVNPQMYEIRE